jgi:hypothetical protein
MTKRMVTQIEASSGLDEAEFSAPLQKEGEHVQMSLAGSSTALLSRAN